MKRIAYLLLLIFLATQILSCGGSRSDLQGTRINVFFRDSLSIPHEYNLLSVRDSELVVAPGFYDVVGKPFTLSNTKIYYVMHAGDGKAKGMLLGGLIGLAAGAATVLGIAQASLNANLGVALVGVGIISWGITLGIFIGKNLSSDEDKFDLAKAHDRYELGGYAKYPDTEPPELQKIK